MKFEDRVRKHLPKKMKQQGGSEEFKRKNLIAIISSRVGNLSSIDLNKVDTTDLFKLADAISRWEKPKK